MGRWFTNSQFAVLSAQISALSVKIDNLTKKEAQQMAALDDKLTALTAEVANDTTVIGGAVKVINGIAAQIAAAVAAAQAAGATPAQLQALTDLTTTLQANDKALADAVAANTPAAPVA